MKILSSYFCCDLNQILVAGGCCGYCCLFCFCNAIQPFGLSDPTQRCLRSSWGVDFNHFFGGGGFRWKMFPGDNLWWSVWSAFDGLLIGDRSLSLSLSWSDILHGSDSCKNVAENSIEYLSNKNLCKNESKCWRQNKILYNRTVLFGQSIPFLLYLLPIN